MPPRNPIRSSDSGPVRVVIVGGGIAALESVLALHELAGGHVAVTMITPEPAFVMRPLDVARPFGRERPGRLDLDRFMADHGGVFRRGAMRSVDTDRRVLRCSTGPDERYDVLIVAVGATTRPALPHVLTLGADPMALGGLLMDLEHGSSRTVAFVVPDGCAFPLPLYETALMAADEVRDAGSRDVALHLLTPEAMPLELFGPEAGAAVAELLHKASIELHLGVHATVPHAGRVDTGAGEGLDAQRIIAMPRLSGTRIDGLPSDARGYLPVDEHGRVVGVPAVFAAGDAAGHRVKQGGLACQQADAVAAQIAADAGTGIIPVPYEPVLRGRLLTSHGARFLERRTGYPAGIAAHTPLWWPPMKIAGRRLSPYLQAQGLVQDPVRDDGRGQGIDVLVAAA